MKYADIVKRWRELQPLGEDERCAQDCNIIRLVADEPAIMSVVESNYRSCGALKPIVKRRVSELTDSIQSGRLPPRAEATSVYPMLMHVCKQLSTHTHSHDPQVRRWAKVSAECLKTSSLDTLARIIDQDSNLQNVARTSMQWTLSECNKRNVYVMPYIERPS